MGIIRKVGVFLTIFLIMQNLLSKRLGGEKLV